MVAKYSWALSVGAFALLAGCGSGVNVGGVDGPQLDGAWELVEGKSAAGSVRPIVEYPITLTIEGSEIGGVSGCNHYGARLRETADGVKVARVSSTDAGCNGPVLRSETRFMGALLSVTAGEVTESGLTLTGPQTRLVFQTVPAVPTRELVGTRWILESLLSGDTSSTPSSSAQLILKEDGTFEGTTGCRRFAGEYVVHGGTVHAPILSADLPGGGAVVERCRAQDSQVLSVLQYGFRVRIDNGSMTVTSRGGEGLSTARTDVSHRTRSAANGCGLVSPVGAGRAA